MQLNLNNFSLLHNHLMSILTTNNFEHERLPQKIMQYIGMIVESQKNPNLREDFFDFFCENGGNKIIKLTLQVEPMLSVQVLAMLFINLTSQQWISYLLCQSFVVNAIQFDQTPAHQQWPQYYISLLKSLSIRFNQQQLSLFFNKKFSKFPLIYESLKYYNHPDCMVRTNVMNIILGIMKIKDKKLVKYFGSFPFTSYVITYCCQVMARVADLDAHLGAVGAMKDGIGDKEQRNKHYAKTKSYYIDIIDYICYLNDLIELGSAQLAYFVMNSILTYIALPSLKNLLEPKPLLTNSTLFLMLTLYKTITNQNFKATLTLLLLARQLPNFFIQKLNNIKNTSYSSLSSPFNSFSSEKCKQIYIPKVYTEQFNPNKYYWNRYQYQVEKQCMLLFQDVNNFQTEHQSKEEDLEKKKEFQEEIGKISRSLGFGILGYEPLQHMTALIQLPNILGFQPNTTYNYMSIPHKLSQQSLARSPNPLRNSLFSLFQSSISEFPSDSLLLCLCTLINTLSKCQTTDNKILQFCGILLPRLDTVNYKQEYNVKSMQNIKDIWVMFMKKINQAAVQRQKNEQSKDSKEGKGIVDEGFFSIETIRSFMVLGFQCFFDRLSQKQQQVLLQFYRNSTIQFKQLIVKKNMKFIVQNFEQLYAKWIKQSLFFNSSLNQSVLSPRKSAKQLSSQQQDESSHQQNRLYFKDSKQKVVYFIKKFIISQTFYFKYHEQYLSKLPNSTPLYNQKYTTISYEKYSKIEQMLKIGQSYQLGFKHMIECYSQEKKSKNTKKQIIVENDHNFLLVEPSNEENTAKIIINHPWKYVTVEVDRETGKKMLIKLKNGRMESKTCIYFEDEARNVGTLDWMNGLKYERYQSEQAFILGYIKQCMRN